VIWRPLAALPRRRSRSAGSDSWLSLATLLALAALGCGRKATVEDCEQIVKRITELELESVVPEQELGAEVQQTQETFRQRALSDCVGKRISDKSLGCVATAKSSATIIDECLD
jgi:hypothetical protein